MLHCISEESKFTLCPVDKVPTCCGYIGYESVKTVRVCMPMPKQTVLFISLFCLLIMDGSFDARIEIYAFPVAPVVWE